VRYVAVAGGNAFYLKADGRSSDLRVASAKPMTEVAARSDSAKETTLADAAPQPTLIQRLFASISTTQSNTQSDRPGSVFGARSLACEDERVAAGR
jgi:hypothetical protein